MDESQLARVRQFNRTLTRRIGALSDDYLGSGRPLAEARLLFEIGPGGSSVRELRTRLALDSGYLSRLLRTLEAQGDSANGLLTTLHYADDLTLPRDKAFRFNYAKTYKLQPDVYAVQGYDAAQLLAAGLKAAGGDIGKRDAVVKGMREAKIDSPRGPFTMSKAHNPIQDIYLRKVEGKMNRSVSVAVKGLADPARGCRM